MLVIRYLMLLMVLVLAPGLEVDGGVTRWEEPCHPSKQPASAPNIIFILADDLGYGDLSCYGQIRFQTPHLDALAKSGVRFTSFYAGSTVCAPSRSTFLTGQHTGHTTVRSNGMGSRRVPLGHTDTTVAMALKRAGYYTGAIGKWGVGEANTLGVPLAKGFDYWYGFLNQKKAHEYYPDKVWENDIQVAIPANANGKREEHVQSTFTQKAVDFISTHASGPFFLYLAYTTPHAELVAEPEALRQFKGKYPEEPFEGSKTYPPNDYPRASYAAMIHQLDQDVGSLLATLDSLKLKENTLVIFASDNGPESEGKHGCDPHFFNSTAGLRGSKRTLYEGGIRVPMIASWPGTIPAERVDTSVWAMWDLFPTIAEVAGAEIPTGLDGRSMASALLSDNRDTDYRFLFWEFHRPGYESILACRYGRFKAVYYYGSGQVELYDLSQNPEESQNVALQYPELCELLRYRMLDERTESPYWSLSTEKHYNPLNFPK